MMANYASRSSWACAQTRRQRTSFANRTTNRPDGYRSRRIQTTVQRNFAKWHEEANTAPLPICFPPDILSKFEKHFWHLSELGSGLCCFGKSRLRPPARENLRSRSG